MHQKMRFRNFFYVKFHTSHKQRKVKDDGWIMVTYHTHNYSFSFSIVSNSWHLYRKHSDFVGVSNVDLA